MVQEQQEILQPTVFHSWDGISFFVVYLLFVLNV